MRRPVFAAPRPTGSSDAPIAELNITPLIDVMLVLLVMFILLVPTLTHKVPIDLPQGPSPTLPLVPHRPELSAAGQAVLDGRALSDAALGGALATMFADPQAMLTMRTDPTARYERFDQVLAVVKRAGVTRLGFEGHEAMRW